MTLSLRMSICLSLLLLFPAAASAEPFHHSFGEWREYNRDWLAACPDEIVEGETGYYGTSCFASTGSQQLNAAGLPAYKITLILDRLDGDLDVAFTFAPTEGSTLDQTRPLTLRFSDSVPMQFAFGGDLETRYNTSNQFFVSNVEKLDVLLDAMRDKARATMLIPVGEADSHQSVEFSMHGVIASIDFMQAYARRLSTYD
ncbi:hypothetical protein GCM10007989_27780 [Devosia pacifica]|uniref:Invasion associated locus B (IalB) protein n=1 Tax=Devosia pacifica TaxID=1335967 RepID=A0A918S9Z0_9HYPH|nr:hypothetical protein [Devosia pacifica]GHA30444.1 hypothetical protein GCM10007989_27780 [Devosia pacifica]